MSEPRTLLVVGAAGFVGSHVCRVAEESDSGLRVVGADRDGGDGLVCDLLDPDSVRGCMASVEPDLVINMAGAASVAAGWKDPAQAFAVNATGVLNLLEAVAGESPDSHLVCVSSAEVYGEPRAGRLPFAEEEPLEPVNPYGAAKAAMEMVCGQYARGRGLRIAVIRAFNQLGPGQASTFAAPGFARQIAAAEVAGADRVELSVGNLDAARDFTDVRDTARAFVEVSERELTGTYNLCSGRAVKLATLVEEMRKAASLPVEVVTDPSLLRPADPSTAYGTPGRLREALGWEPRIPLSQSVEDLLAWWRDRLRSAAGRPTQP